MAAAADLTRTLEKALAKLTKNEDEAALDALLTAWRARRVPRIADVIDRVSDRIMSVRGGAITAKTVKERTAKWLALAKKKDAADLGSLLATPWPGTWQDALPVLQPLLKFPDDPRIAMALALVVDATPFDTWTSNRFYRPLFELLQRILDLRTLPILEADADRAKSSYWHVTRSMETQTITLLKKTYPKRQPPALSDKEEEALARLEAVFASSISDERAKAKGEADFLAAIYADPDDDALREVFADWLTERNDPRGELIALQLARHGGRSNEASLKRESALLNKHGKQWAGALDRVLSKDNRVFSRGFLSAGVLELKGSPKDLPKVLHDPAWATFDSLEIGWSARELSLQIAALPSMRWLRVMRGLTEGALVELAKKEPRPRFEELDFHAGNGAENAAQDREHIVEAKAFPNVKRLSFAPDVVQLEWVLEGALGRRLEQITVYDYNLPIRELARLAERFKGKSKLPALTRVSVMTSYHRGSEWRLTASQDAADGRFTKIHGEPVHLRSIPSRYSLERALTPLQPGEITELTIEREHVHCNYDANDIEILEARLKTFGPKLTRIEVPWDRVQTASTTPGTPFRVDLNGGKRLSGKTSFSKVWQLVSEPPLSLSFDSYSINNGKHMSLPSPAEDALEHLLGYYDKKRTRSIQAYRKGSRDTCSLDVDVKVGSLNITSAFRDAAASSGSTSATTTTTPSTFVDDYVAWLVRLLDTPGIDVDVGSSGFQPPLSSETNTQALAAFRARGGVAPILEPLQYSPRFGWLSILGTTHQELLSFDDLERVAKTSPDLSWLKVVQTPTKRNAILIAGPRPSELIDVEGQRAFQVAVSSVMWRGYERSRGFVPRDLVLEKLGPPLKKLGFEPTEPPPFQHGLGYILFTSRSKSLGACGILFIPISPMQESYARLRIKALNAPDDPNANLMTETGPPRTLFLSYPADISILDAKVAKASIEKLLPRIENELMAWFANEPPKEPAAKKKKGR